MNDLANTITAVTLAGLGRERTARAWIAWAADAGFRAVVLDAAAPDMRARDLGRSARRELASLLRRHELEFAGFDLWIPPEHLSSPQHLDRAASAVAGAIDLAGEVAALNMQRQAVVSLTLPDDIAPETLAYVGALATGAGVSIADHHWPPRSDAVLESIGVGFDPAEVILSGGDPQRALIAYAGRLACVRLTDADQAARRTPGAGQLDLDEYRIATHAAQWTGPIIIDARGLASPAEQAVTALRRWTGRA